jgi:hypothetical protein
VGAAQPYFNQRADLTCDPSRGAPHTPNIWFNYSCFAMPASPFVPGSAPAYLDHVRTDGAKDVDLSLYKSFPIRETKALRFDVSAYNVANRPQFGQPGVPSLTAVQTAPTPQPGQLADQFGFITSTVNNPRQYQFGARFTF